MDLFPIMGMTGYRGEEYVAKLRVAGVMFAVIGVPFGMIEAHTKQCQKNHSQSPTRLAERGGLSVCEALAVIENREWRALPDGEAALLLIEYATLWVNEH